MRANMVVLLYDDHDRAVKLLHSLDRTMWSGKVEAILEFEKYETLTVDELFSKLKSSEVDHGVRGKIENPTDPYSMALVSGSRTNANMSSRQFPLSCLVSMPDEEFDVLGKEDLALLSRLFERMYTNRKNAQRSFESAEFPHKVYRLRKALYGLKQAPRALYGRLRRFLFNNGFEMGKLDKTLFLLRQGDDILIVQVYVDGIVFGGSSHSLVARFAEDMSKQFEMSMMGELQFFLGLQIKQAKEGTFVHQA
jgi:hypothetical protein